MIELKENEEFIKEYPAYYLIKVKCPNNQFYRTTAPKWQQTDFTHRAIKYDTEARLDKKVGGMNI